MLTQLRMQSGDEGGEAGGQEITQEMLEEMLQSSAELDLENMEGRPMESTGTFADNMLKEAGLNLPESPDMGQGPLVHVDEDGGPLDPNEPQTFVYDEWDFRADDYKPNWCIVRQRANGRGRCRLLRTDTEQPRPACEPDKTPVRAAGPGDASQGAQARGR